MNLIDLLWVTNFVICVVCIDLFMKMFFCPLEVLSFGWQLFSYSIKKFKTRQITLPTNYSTKHNKDDNTSGSNSLWQPCGNFLMFTHIYTWSWNQINIPVFTIFQHCCNAKENRWFWELNKIVCIVYSSCLDITNWCCDITFSFKVPWKERKSDPFQDITIGGAWLPRQAPGYLATWALTFCGKVSNKKKINPA